MGDSDLMWAGDSGVGENDTVTMAGEEAQGMQGNKYMFSSVLFPAPQQGWGRWMPGYKVRLPLSFLWELSQLLNLLELFSIKPKESPSGSC